MGKDQSGRTGPRPKPSVEEIPSEYHCCYTCTIHTQCELFVIAGTPLLPNTCQGSLPLSVEVHLPFEVDYALHFADGKMEAISSNKKGLQIPRLSVKDYCLTPKFFMPK